MTDRPAPGTIWTHKENGLTHRIMHYAILKAAGNSLNEEVVLVITAVDSPDKIAVFPLRDFAHKFKK